MVHISLRCNICIKTIQLLSLRKRGQCYNVTDLCLSSCEHSRTMDSRNDINLSSQWTDLCDLSAIWTLVILQNHLTNCLLLVLVNSLIKDCQPVFLICKCLFKLLLDLADVLLTYLLLVCEDCLFHCCRWNKLLDCLKQLFRNCAACIRMLWLTTLSYDLIDKRDYLLV